MWGVAVRVVGHERRGGYDGHRTCGFEWGLEVQSVLSSALLEYHDMSTPPPPPTHNPPPTTHHTSTPPMR